MSEAEAAPPALTLDPRTPEEWAAFRALAHRMVDDTLDHLAGLRDAPAWRRMPDEVRASIRGEPLPWAGAGAEAAYRDYVERVRPYPNGNLHPRFWGWVQGTGTPLGAMADMLAAALNPHLAGFDQAPALVEHQVVAWLAEVVGMPPGASGVLVTGGTMANVLGVAVARHVAAQRAGFDVREDGLQRGGRPCLTLYASAETHGWARKAAELLGLGARALRTVPVDAADRIDLGALAAAVRADRRAGHLPCCAIGTAGTVNTGATDDLAALADFCRGEGLWFHVDGAFGALARLSEELRPLVAGIERADSVGLDLHKWGWLPFGCACALVGDAALHRAAFATAPVYLAGAARGVIAGGLPFADRGVDLTRGFSALKVWLSLKAQGASSWARLIEQNVRDARRLAALVDAHPELELLAPAALNVVCFRYAPPGAPDDAPGDELDAINREVLLRVQESGTAVPSGTTVRGRYAIRVANVNHRSRPEDFDALVEAVVRFGREVARDASRSGAPWGRRVRRPRR